MRHTGQMTEDYEETTKVTAVIPISLKKRLKQYSEKKRWTMSAAIVFLLERCLLSPEERRITGEIQARKTKTRNAPKIRKRGRPRKKKEV